MELNRDQIIKALECCASSTSSEACDGCPFNEMELCDQESNALEKHALALIKELTKENERIKADTIRNMRTHIFNKAVYPDGTREHAYITLKVFDGIVEEMLKNKK